MTFNQKTNNPWCGWCPCKIGFHFHLMRFACLSRLQRVTATVTVQDFSISQRNRRNRESTKEMLTWFEALRMSCSYVKEAFFWASWEPFPIVVTTLESSINRTFGGKVVGYAPQEDSESSCLRPFLYPSWEYATSWSQFYTIGFWCSSHYKLHLRAPF